MVDLIHLTRARVLAVVQVQAVVQQLATKSKRARLKSRSDLWIPLAPF